MNKKIIAIALLGIAGTTTIQGQPAGAVRLALEPGSQLSFEGTSTLHGFTCKTDKLEAYIDVDSSYRTKSLTELSHPIVSVKVLVPVKSLVCGSKKLESNMFNTLRADEYPTIRYVLTDYSMVGDSVGPNGFVAKTTGSLTIAGTEQPIEMRVVSARASDGTVTAKAEQAILMKEYGVKPPTFMFGTLRVGNRIVIRFDIKATQANIAAAVGAAHGQAGIASAAK